MSRKKKTITLALDPDLLDRLQAWLDKQDLPPTKTKAFEVALRRFLDDEEANR